MIAYEEAMKKRLAALCIVGAAASAHASEYGCTVLLCLANPVSNGGPMGIAACAGPITQLYHDLGKGRPFPACDLAHGNDGSSYARQVHDSYDPCPTPLQPVAPGSYIVKGQWQTNGGKPGWLGGNGSYVLVGQPQISEAQNDHGVSTGARACVGKAVGTYTAGSHDDTYTVNVFDQVVWQPAQHPRAIDVYIDGQWHQRVRW